MSNSSAGVRVCGSCQISMAEVFCACSGARVYLCGRCMAEHTTVKYRDLIHQFIRADIEIFDLDKYGERNKFFAAGRTELRDNLHRIEQCCQEITDTFDAMIERLKQSRDYYVGGLQEWKDSLKAEIERCENEVKATLAQDEVQLEGQFSALLRDYRPGSFELFRYQVDASGFEDWVSKVVKLEYPSEHSAEPSDHPQNLETLVRLLKGQIELFSFESDSFGSAARLSRPLTFDSNSKYTLLDASRVFCCGHDTGSKAAYIVHIASGAVEDLPPLGVARSGPGLLSHLSAVFVFGTFGACYAGMEAHGKEVETMQLDAQAWVRLPDMNSGRYNFTPCTYNTRVYLCTAKDASIDVLDLQSMSYLVPLPKVTESCIGAVSVVVDHELVIITDKTTTVVSLNDSATRRQQHKLSVSPSSMPVVYQRCIYWVNSSGKCVKVSGSHFEVAKELSR